eukprot:UN02417
MVDIFRSSSKFLLLIFCFCFFNIRIIPYRSSLPYTTETPLAFRHFEMI